MHILLVGILPSGDTLCLSLYRCKGRLGAPGQALGIGGCSTIHAPAVQIETYEGISLFNVEITHRIYGIGTISAQKGNEIKVQISGW